MVSARSARNVDGPSVREAVMPQTQASKGGVLLRDGEKAREGDTQPPLLTAAEAVQRQGKRQLRLVLPTGARTTCGLRFLEARH